MRQAVVIDVSGNSADPAGHGSGTAGRMRASPSFVLLVFLIAQIVDGLLTYTAVAMLEVIGEGNLLLAAAMDAAGAGPALVVAKAAAAAGGFLLYRRGCHGILGALTAFYMVGAITPWLYVFHNL